MTFENAGVFRDLARTELVSMLSEIKGSTTIACQSEIFPMMQKIASSEFLTGLGVKRVMQLKANSALPDGADAYMFICSPTVYMTRLICEKINEKPDNAYQILYVPRFTATCEQIIESEGLHDVVSVSELNLTMISFDLNILTLESPKFLKDFYLKKVETQLYEIARSIVALNGVFGLIPRIVGFSKTANRVFQTTDRMMRECSSEFENLKVSDNIKTLVIMDRSRSFFPIFVKSTTYSGVIAEYFRVTVGTAEIVLPVSGQQNLKFSIDFLNDKLYQELAFLSLYQVSELLLRKMCDVLGQPTPSKQRMSTLKSLIPKLSKDHINLRNHALLIARLTYLRDSYDNRKINEYEKFILSGVPRSRSKLSAVVGAKTEGNEKHDGFFDCIRECLCKRIPYIQPLRLLCLYSLQFNGIPETQFLPLKKQFLHTYGFNHLHTLSRLEKLGILYEAEKENNSKGLSIATSNSNQTINKKQEYINYVNQVIEAEFNNKVEDTLKDEDDFLKIKPINIDDKTNIENKNKSKNICVFAIGGLLHDEVAKLKSACPKGTEMLFCTTKMLTTKSFFEEIEITKQ